MFLTDDPDLEKAQDIVTDEIDLPQSICILIGILLASIPFALNYIGALYH